MRNNNLAYEKFLWNNGYQCLAGVDEVGRGPLAGPVMACAVIFDKNYYHSEVTDSKKLSAKRREILAKALIEMSVTFGIGEASVSEIEFHNIRQATFIAMRRAIEKLSIGPDYLLIDGENIPETSCPSRGIIRGDSQSFTISAASIIAKVARDKFMQELDCEYPEYKFAKNKGYGTAEHISAIRKIGPSPHHRNSFLRKILAD